MLLNIRTDLVTEENISADTCGDITTEKKTVGEIEIEKTEIKSDSAAKRIRKPKGKYCTLRFERLDGISETDALKSALVATLNGLTDVRDNALVVGLGNSDITPDALGPLCVNSVIATRHITENLKRTLGLEKLHRVSCLAPSVLGKTGIEAVDIIKATADAICPEIIIAVDALAANTPKNLCRTVQMTDSGIAPGSGVKNRRAALCKETLGVPVIAIGVPTVIDAGYLSDDLKTDDDMMVTPKEIDLLVSRAADVIARAINMFLQPSLTEDIIESLS